MPIVKCLMLMVQEKQEEYPVYELKGNISYQAPNGLLLYSKHCFINFSSLYAKSKDVVSVFLILNK